MFKKLLAITAIAAVGLNVNAKTIVDVDYSYEGKTWNLYEMGYSPEVIDGVLTSTNPVEVDEETGEEASQWYQYFMMPAFAAEIGTTYDVTFTVKGSVEGEVNVQARWSWSEDAINAVVPVTTEWSDVTVSYEVGGTNIDLIFQSGGFVGTIYWSRIVVSHEEKESTHETEWEEWLVNGDAEGEYGEVPCAYAKEYQGRGADNSEIASPVPAEIVDMDGSKVFIVRAKTVDPNDCPAIFLDEEGKVKGDPEWQNQFWIQSPKAWNTNDQVRISFRYKADKPASADTQAHSQNPGSYLHWELLGSINFTTEWQEFSKVVTVNSNQNGMWSAAFNLKEYTMDNNYYFDDLKWETMKLDEGWFVAGDFNDWNYDEALELAWNEDDGEYQGVIGTLDTPASQMCISTKRGNDSAFKANCIKTAADLEEGEYVDFTTGFQKINLPEAGVWLVCIDPEYSQISVSATTNSLFDGIAEDNAAPVYYNLQGIQVINPQPGKVYIVKRGAKVTKNFIR